MISIVILVSAVGFLASARRALQLHIELGQWIERAFVIESFDEARRRGMSAEEWLEAYGERADLEAMRQGLDKPVRNARSWRKKIRA